MSVAEYTQNWELDTLLPHPDSEEFSTLLANFRQDLRELADQSDSLRPIGHESVDREKWALVLTEYSRVTTQAEDLESFIGCHAAADAENALYRKYEAELAALAPLRSQIRTNIEFGVKESAATDLSQFSDSDAVLSSNLFFLQECQRNAQLRLPKSEEALYEELGVDGIHAWGRSYDRLSGELRVRVMEKGELVEKSPGQVTFDSPERSVRENNFYAADHAWRSVADSCADALNHISGTRLTRYRRLGLTDHLDAPLRFNRMQRNTLNTMWSAIAEQKQVLLPYFEKKAELLGLEQLAWYDLQAPLSLPGTDVGSADISYAEACDRIITTFTTFDEELGDFARRALADHWVEAEDRSGKRQGGFCTGFPGRKQSRIFMTFTGTVDGMSTLAHELGHAYHSWVIRDEPVLLQDYPMSLAETASTFAEAVLGEHLLEAADSPAAELRLLDNMLGDAIAFLMNIHTRFLFEDEFHRERQSGEVSPDRLSEMMRMAQKEAYLDALSSDGWNESFWISKLHFYISGLPFYNFPYTFGYLLSQGMLAEFRKESAGFASKYQQFLLATCQCESEEAVRRSMGYDLTERSFWNQSLDIVASRVERFLRLAH